MQLYEDTDDAWTHLVSILVPTPDDDELETMWEEFQEEQDMIARPVDDNLSQTSRNILVSWSVTTPMTQQLPCRQWHVHQDKTHPLYYRYGAELSMDRVTRLMNVSPIHNGKLTLQIRKDVWVQFTAEEAYITCLEYKQISAPLINLLDVVLLI